MMSGQVSLPYDFRSRMAWQYAVGWIDRVYMRVCVCVCLLLLKLGDKAAPRSELNLQNPSLGIYGDLNEISKKNNIFLIILIKSA